MDKSINNNITDIERIIKTTADQEKVKIHKLKTKTDEILVVSQKEKNDSYCFFEPSISSQEGKVPAITLKPIEDIFDYLEEKEVNMNITENNESEEFYARTK